jgi:hypothetical protein
MQRRLSHHEMLLVQGLVLLLRWVLARFLPGPSGGDLEQGHGDLIAQAHARFTEVLDGLSSTSPAAPGAPTTAAAGVVPPSTSPASPAGPVVADPATRAAEPSPEPGTAPMANSRTVYATNKRLEAHTGCYHLSDRCRALVFNKAASSEIWQMSEEAALECHLRLCQICLEPCA